MVKSSKFTRTMCGTKPADLSEHVGVEYTIFAALIVMLQIVNVPFLPNLVDSAHLDICSVFAVRRIAQLNGSCVSTRH